MKLILLLFSLLYFGCVSADTLPPQECQFCYKFPNADTNGVLRINQFTRQAVNSCSNYQTLRVNFITNLPVGWVSTQDGGNGNWTTYLLLNGNRQESSSYYGSFAGINFPSLVEDTRRPNLTIPSNCAQNYNEYEIMVTFAFMPFGHGLVSQLLYDTQQFSIGIEICDRPPPNQRRCIRSQIENIRVTIDRTQSVECYREPVDPNSIPDPGNY